MYTGLRYTCVYIYIYIIHSNIYSTAQGNMEFQTHSNSWGVLCPVQGQDLDLMVLMGLF